MAQESRIVVVAVDPSDFAEYAFDWYVKYMHQPANEVLCLHCMEISEVEKLEKEISKGARKCDAYSQVTELEERFQHNLDKLKIRGRVLTVKCKKPGETICEKAQEVRAFAIVTGTRGRSKIEKVLLGSVSEYCVKNAGVPVIVVRKRMGDLARQTLSDYFSLAKE